MGFLRPLLATDEAGVDSIIVGGLFALVALIGVSVYLAIVDHASWSPAGYAGAVVLIMGAMAGGKTVRDRFSAGPAAPGAGQ